MDSSLKLPKIDDVYVVMDSNGVYGVYTKKEGAEEIVSYYPDELFIVKTELHYN